MYFIIKSKLCGMITLKYSIFSSSPRIMPFHIFKLQDIIRLSNKKSKVIAVIHRNIFI